MFVSFSIKMSNLFLPWNREAGPEDRCWWLLSHKFYLVVSGVKSGCKQWGNQWRANLKRENHQNGTGVNFFDSRGRGGGGEGGGGVKGGNQFFPKEIGVEKWPWRTLCNFFYNITKRLDESWEQKLFFTFWLWGWCVR